MLLADANLGTTCQIRRIRQSSQNRPWQERQGLGYAFDIAGVSRELVCTFGLLNGCRLKHRLMLGAVDFGIPASCHPRTAFSFPIIDNATVCASSKGSTRLGIAKSHFNSNVIILIHPTRLHFHSGIRLHRIYFFHRSSSVSYLLSLSNLCSQRQAAST